MKNIRFYPFFLLIVLCIISACSEQSEKSGNKNNYQPRMTNSYIEGTADCPNLEDAEFPFYDNNGNMHFCRKCDIPKADDPKCVRNIWQHYQDEYIKGFPDRDCDYYPCELKKNVPWTDPLYQCYSQVPLDWTVLTGNPAIKHLGFNDGKLAIGLASSPTEVDWLKSPTDYRIFEYDVNTKKYRIIMPGDINSFSYHKGNLLAYLYDIKNISMDKPYKSFMLYYDKNKGYEVAYNKPISYMAMSSLSDKYAVAIIQETDDSPYMVAYAEIGKWEWKEIFIGGSTLEGTSGAFSVVGNHFAFHNSPDYAAYYCDLSKNPASYTDCTKLNDETKARAFYAQIDQENEQRVIFTDEMNDKITLVDFSSGKPEYTYLPYKPSEKYIKFAGGESFRGNLFLFGEKYSYNPEDTYDDDRKFCFYRVDKKKSYCEQRAQPDPKRPVPLYAKGAMLFDGKKVLYSSYSGQGAHLVDVDCLMCQGNPEKCPFDGMDGK